MDEMEKPQNLSDVMDYEDGPREKNDYVPENKNPRCHYEPRCGNPGTLLIMVMGRGANPIPICEKCKTKHDKMMELWVNREEKGRPTDEEVEAALEEEEKIAPEPEIVPEPVQAPAPKKKVETIFDYW